MEGTGQLTHFRAVLEWLTVLYMTGLLTTVFVQSLGEAGLVELDREFAVDGMSRTAIQQNPSVEPGFGGRVPDVFGGLVAVLVGLSVYILLAVVIIAEVFIYVLLTGESIDALSALHASVAIAVLITPTVQEYATLTIRESEWLRGWGHGL